MTVSDEEYDRVMDCVRDIEVDISDAKRSITDLLNNLDKDIEINLARIEEVVA